MRTYQTSTHAAHACFFSFQCDKTKQLFYQAKYGRFGLGDAFLALQRDSESQKNDDFDENGLKAMYDNQLGQLENLIATQRRGQQRMREQLHAMEKKYYKVTGGCWLASVAVGTGLCGIVG